VPRKPVALQLVWTHQTGQSRAPWFGGTGWTGQPAIVRWPDVIRHSMPRLGERTRQAGFVEVIQGSLDGRVHFLDLQTGKPSRPAIVTGNPIKGSVSLDPRGYPLLFVGQGIPENVPIGLRVYELIGHTEVAPRAPTDAPWRRACASRRCCRGCGTGSGPFHEKAAPSQAPGPALWSCG